MSPAQYERVISAARARGRISRQCWGLIGEGPCCPLGAAVIQYRDEVGKHEIVDADPLRLASRIIGCEYEDAGSFMDAVDGIDYDPARHRLEWYQAGVRMWRELEAEGVAKA